MFSEEDVAAGSDTYNVFKLTTPSWAPYCTSNDLEAENMERLATFARENLTGGLRSLSLVGAWQLSFRECARLGLLEADESHPRHPQRVVAENELRNAASEAAAFKARVQAMSSFQIKQAGVREPGFSERYAALVAGERTRL
jgi:hypothetical protein